MAVVSPLAPELLNPPLHDGVFPAPASTAILEPTAAGIHADRPDP